MFDYNTERANTAAQHLLRGHPDDFVMISGMEAATPIGRIAVVGPLIFTDEVQGNIRLHHPVTKQDLDPILERLKYNPRDVEFTILGFQNCLVKPQFEEKCNLVITSTLDLSQDELLALKATINFFVFSMNDELRNVKSTEWN